MCTLLTLIAADHKTIGAVSLRLTLMESTVFHLKRQVNLLFLSALEEIADTARLFTVMGLELSAGPAASFCWKGVDRNWLIKQLL